MVIRKAKIITALALGLLIVGCAKTSVKGELLSVSVFGTTVNGTYTGSVKDNIPNGEGEIIIDSASSAKGTFTEGTFTQGNANHNVYTLDVNGKKYTGTYTGAVSEGVPEGEGTFESGNKDASNFYWYTGTWEKGNPAGSGTVATDEFSIYIPSQDVSRTGRYEGEVKDGIANGQGTFSAVNSSNVKYTYEGSFKDGVMDGDAKNTFFYGDTSLTQVGLFTNGEYTPNLRDSLITISSMFGYGEISNAQSTFFDENEQLFKGNGTNADADLLLSEDYDFKTFNPRKCAQSPYLIKLNNAIIHFNTCENYFNTTQDYPYTDLIVGINAKDGSEEVYELMMYGDHSDLGVNTRANIYLIPINYYDGVTSNDVVIQSICGFGFLAKDDANE